MLASWWAESWTWTQRLLFHMENLVWQRLQRIEHHHGFKSVQHVDFCIYFSALHMRVVESCWSLSVLSCIVCFEDVLTTRSIILNSSNDLHCFENCTTHRYKIIQFWPKQLHIIVILHSSQQLADTPSSLTYSFKNLYFFVNSPILSYFPSSSFTLHSKRHTFQWPD